MWKIVFFIMDMVMNNWTKEQMVLEILNILKDKVSKQNIDKLTEYIWEESLEMKRALSRENMLSNGVSREHVDYVIEEIKIFSQKIEKTGEIRSQCGYQSMELANFLWDEYCRVNAEDKDKIREFGNEIKKGLFAVAKAWNEPPKESEESCIEFLKRIDSKSSSILRDVEEIKGDTKEVRNHTAHTEREVVKMSSSIGEISSETEKIGTTTERTYNLLKEVHQQLLYKDNEKNQNTGDGAEQNSCIREDDPASLTQEQKEMPELEVSEAEETLPDEIKIYLAASPDEFQNDIDSLQKFVEEQNQCQNAVRLTLHCYGEEEKQDIRTCKYCYLLVGTRAETWMWEVYEQAYRLNPNGGCSADSVQLRLFFKNISDREADQGDDSRAELENRYRKDFGQVPFYFSDNNRIKLDILQSLRVEAPDVAFSTKEVLQFQNNGALEEARKKRALLQAQYEEAGRILLSVSSPEAKKNMESLGKELKDQNETVRRMEKDIWDNLNLLTDKLQNKKAMDKREVEAIESVIEYGDYEKAGTLLCSTDWRQEITDLEQSMNDRKEILKQFISSQRTLISNLKTKDTNRNPEEEITEIYKNITALSKEWQIEYVTLYEFAEFLLNQKKETQGIEVGEHLKCLYGLSGHISAEEKARLSKLLGNLYYRNTDYEKSEKAYGEAIQILNNEFCEKQELLLEIYNDLAQLLWKTNKLQRAEGIFKENAEILDRLVENDPETYEPILAFTYNHLAILANRRNHLDEAVKYHLKTMEIRERLVKKSSSYNSQAEVRLAHTYNNLGFSFKKMEDYENADIYYHKSIDIRCRNVKKNPSVYRPLLGVAYNNYAILLNVTGDNKGAQDFCKEALAIRRGLAQENPSYKAELASTLNEYGIIMGDAHQYSQAEGYLKEAIEIRKGLTEKDRTAHRVNLAETYRNYGKLLIRKGRAFANEQFYREAEEKLKKALAYFSESAQENPDYDIEKIAETYQVFGDLLSNFPQRYSEAEEYYQEAIEGWKVLSERCRQAYEHKLKETERALLKLKARVY